MSTQDHDLDLEITLTEERRNLFNARAGNRNPHGAQDHTRGKVLELLVQEAKRQGIEVKEFQERRVQGRMYPMLVGTKVWSNRQINQLNQYIQAQIQEKFQLSSIRYENQSHRIEHYDGTYKTVTSQLIRDVRINDRIIPFSQFYRRRLEENHLDLPLLFAYRFLNVYQDEFLRETGFKTCVLEAFYDDNGLWDHHGCRIRDLIAMNWYLAHNGQYDEKQKAELKNLIIISCANTQRGYAEPEAGRQPQIDGPVCPPGSLGNAEATFQTYLPKVSEAIVARSNPRISGTKAQTGAFQRIFEHIPENRKDAIYDAVNGCISAADGWKAQLLPQILDLRVIGRSYIQKHLHEMGFFTEQEAMPYLSMFLENDNPQQREAYLTMFVQKYTAQNGPYPRISQERERARQAVEPVEQVPNQPRPNPARPSDAEAQPRRRAQETQRNEQLFQAFLAREAEQARTHQWTPQREIHGRRNDNNFGYVVLENPLPQRNLWFRGTAREEVFPNIPLNQRLTIEQNTEVARYVFRVQNR